MPLRTRRQLAFALVLASLAFGYVACSSPPPYDGGGRNIDNAIVSGGGSATPKDSGLKDTSLPDVNVPDTSTGG